MSSELSAGEQERFRLFGAIAGKLAVQLQSACRTCVTCEHFDEPRVKCKLNEQTPPPRIIAYGCECYEDEIPF